MARGQDNYQPTNSHVLLALIRRFYETLEASAPSVTCWGTGTPLREFLHDDELGDACVLVLEPRQPGPEDQQFLNVGTGMDLTVRELAEAVAFATGFQGEIHWDASKPDGTPKKQLNVSRLEALGWRARNSLRESLKTIAPRKWPGVRAGSEMIGCWSWRPRCARAATGCISTAC